MALFGRDREPSRATLSRFLAALDQPAVESLRTLLSPRTAGSSAGKRGTVRWDVRSAREPLPRLRCGWHARGSEPSRLAKNGGSAGSEASFASTVCPRLHRGQTRGSRALAYHGLTGAYASVDCDVWKPWLRLVPCRTASSRLTAIQSYLQAHHHPQEHALLRLDGQYGTGAILADLAGLPFVMRGKDYQLLKRAEVQARLKLPPDQHLTHPESGMVRALWGGSDHFAGGAAAAHAPESLWWSGKSAVAGSGHCHGAQLPAAVRVRARSAAWHHLGLASGPAEEATGAGAGCVRERGRQSTGNRSKRIAFASRVHKGRPLPTLHHFSR
jgi:hypothetical protein